MTEPEKPSVYYVVFFVTSYTSIEEAQAKAAETIAAHVARSKEFHEQGTLLIAGAFLNNSDEPLSTMAVFTSREAAEEYARGDPFFLKGMVTQWYIREWANMLA